MGSENIIRLTAVLLVGGSCASSYYLLPYNQLETASRISIIAFLVWLPVFMLGITSYMKRKYPKVSVGSIIVFGSISFVVGVLGICMMLYGK